MKAVVKLIVAVAVLNAAVRCGLAAWKYYELKDEAQQAVLFGAATPTDQLRSEIFDKAEELNVPLELDDINVQRNGDRTVASAEYVQPIELLPTYAYPVDFSFTVEGFKSTGLK